MFRNKKNLIKVWINCVPLPDYLESTGPGSYVPVALGGGSRDGEVPVLAAHVVGARPAVVPLPDSTHKKQT